MAWWGLTRYLGRIMGEDESECPFAIRFTVMWAALLVLAGCASVGPVPESLKAVPACKEGQRLEVSQGCRFAVPAREASTVLPVRTVVGDQYKIEVPSGQEWTDLIIESDPLKGDDGFWLINWISKHRRIPDKPWFVLGTARRGAGAGQSSDCRKETGARQVLGIDSLSLSEPGDVVFFANDVCGFDWNNHGGIWVRIERLGKTEQP